MFAVQKCKEMHLPAVLFEKKLSCLLLFLGGNNPSLTLDRTGCQGDPGIVAKTFHLARMALGPDTELALFANEPDGCCDALSRFSKGGQRNVFVPVNHREMVGWMLFGHDLFRFWDFEFRIFCQTAGVSRLAGFLPGPLLETGSEQIRVDDLS